MDRKVLKMATAVILVLTFLIPCTIRRMPDMHEQYALAEEIRSAPILQTHAKASVAPENVVKESNTLNGQLKIEIPQGTDGSRHKSIRRLSDTDDIYKSGHRGKRLLF